jgi:hypothetical protein
MMRLVATSALVVMSGCGSNGSPDLANTGARLSVDYFGDTDVVGFHFEITRVACDANDTFVPETIEGNADLVDGIFPGMISLVEQTLDPSSRHLGSDFFVTLEPGCYDVLAVPASYIDGDVWLPSADCTASSAGPVEVFAGQTSEATLLSQCVGDPTGAIDVLALLNHPPQLWLEIDEKFNYECEPVKVCATVIDVDDDPIEVDWTNLTAHSVFDLDVWPATVVGFEDQHRIWEACAVITTQYVTSYDINVTAYDLGIQNGASVRIETLLQDNPAGTIKESHASLTFPIHTNWVEEPLCWDANGALVSAPGVHIDRAKGCTYTDAEEYYCSGNYWVDPVVQAAICDGYDLLEDVFYPDCD